MSYSHWQRSYGQQGFDFPLSLLSAANRWSSERPWYSKSSLGTPGTWRNFWGSPESFGSGPVCSCLPPRSSRASDWRLPSLPDELRRRPRGRRGGSVRPGLRGSCWTGLASAASCFLRPSLGDFLNQTDELETSLSLFQLWSFIEKFIGRSSQVVDGVVSVRPS